MKLFLITIVIFLSFFSCGKKRVPPTPIPTPTPIIIPTPTPISTPTPFPIPTPFPTPVVDINSYIPPDKLGTKVLVRAVKGEVFADQIQAAQDSPEVGFVTIWGNGILTKQITIRKDTLFQDGEISFDIPNITDFGLIQVANNVKVRQENHWIVEPNYVTNGIPIVIIFQAENSHYKTAENIALLDIRIRPAQENLSAHVGVRQAISMGNCHNCAIINPKILGCGSICIQFGGNGTEGNFAQRVLVSGAEITRNAAAAIAIVNAQDVIIKDSYIYSLGRKGAPGGVSGIDVELNTSHDWGKDIKIFNNIIDYTNSEHTGSAILLQNSDSSIHPTTGLLVANNRVINTVPNLGGMTSGIFFTRDFTNGLVVANYIQRSQQAGIQLYGAADTIFQDNILVNVGGGGLPAIYLQGTRNLTFIRNPIYYLDSIGGSSSGEIWEVDSINNTYDMEVIKK